MPPGPCPPGQGEPPPLLCGQDHLSVCLNIHGAEKEELVRKALQLRAGRALEVIKLPFRLAKWETEAG